MLVFLISSEYSKKQNTFSWCIACYRYAFVTVLGIFRESTDVFWGCWSFGDCWRHLKQWTKTLPLSTCALSIYLWLKVNYWPSLYEHMTFPNNGKAMTERWAYGEFPFFFLSTKQKALLSPNALKNTPSLCSGGTLPAFSYCSAILNASLQQQPPKKKLIIAPTQW